MKINKFLLDKNPFLFRNIFYIFYKY